MRILEPFLTTCCVVLILPIISASQEHFWKQTNGPFGGAVRQIAIDSTDGFALANVNGALYGSPDTGKSWKKFQEDGLPPSIHYSEFWYDKTRNSFFLNPSNGALFEFSRRTNRWEPFSFPDPYASFVALNRNGDLFVSGNSGPIYRTLLRLPSGSHSWDSLTFGFNFGVCENGTLFRTCADSKIYRSTDDGHTWSAIDSSFYFGTQVQAFKTTAHGSLLLRRHQPNPWCPGGSVAEYLSRDYGATWKLLWSSFMYLDEKLTNAMIEDGKENLLVGTNNGVLFYAGIDRPEANPRDKGLSALAITSMAVHPSGFILCGTELGGIFRSSNHGQSWEKADSGIPQSYVGNLSIGPGDAIIASTYGGLYESKDRGVTWNYIHRDLPATRYERYLSVRDATGDLFVAEKGTVFFRAANCGAVTTPILTTFPGISLLKLLRDRDLFVDVNYCHAYSPCGPTGKCTNEFWLTRDQGGSWIRSDSGLGNRDTIGSASVHDVSSIIETPQGTYLLAGMDGLYESVDSGLSWHKIFQLDNADGNVKLVSNGRDAIYRTGIITYGVTGVFRSTDNGFTWSEPDGSFHRTRFGTIMTLPGDRLIVRCFDHSDSLYLSSAHATSWRPLASMGGSGFGLIGSLALSSDGYLYAGTSAHGVLVSEMNFNHMDASDPPALGMPGSFALVQNYPNPFNPKTVIRYQLSVNSFVSLKVYNLLGEGVAVLVNERRPEGENTVMWDASEFPSGVYFYRLVAGRFSDTKKLLLLR